MKRILPLVLALAGFMVVSVLWIVTDRRASQRVYDQYSTANTSESGLSLAAGYLGKRRRVSILTRPLGREPIEHNAVVFRVSEEIPTFFDPEDLEEDEVGPPAPKLQALLTDREEAFIQSGGRIILAAGSGLLPAVHSKAEAAFKVLPIWPAVGDVEVKSTFNSVFTELRPGMLPVYVAGRYVLLARERIGRGELFVLSDPALLQNDQIARNLPLLAALAGEQRPVYFDEAIHGITRGDGALALMKEWNLGPFLLMLAVVTTLVFWRGGRRVGPAEEDLEPVRSDAVDLVRSLGALYREVTSDTEAIALYHDALTRAVAHDSGLRGEALRKRIDELTGGLVPPSGAMRMPQGTFARQLAAVNQGFEKTRKR